eukprot:5793465-Amphidinium_carterae.1
MTLVEAPPTHVQHAFAANQPVVAKFAAKVPSITKPEWPQWICQVVFHWFYCLSSWWWSPSWFKCNCSKKSCCSVKCFCSLLRLTQSKVPCMVVLVDLYQSLPGVQSSSPSFRVPRLLFCSIAGKLWPVAQ